MVSDEETTSSAIFNIAVLSFSDKPVDHIIQAFVQKYPDRVSNQNSSTALEFIPFHFDYDQMSILINLIRPISPHLIDKLEKTYYNEKEGAMILFSKNNDHSFKAAKTFYRKLQKENEDFPIPIAFVELLEPNESIGFTIEEPEVLEDIPQVGYFGLTENAEGFETILRFIIGNYMDVHKIIEKKSLEN
jgi:hypothetical protein